MKKYLTLNLLLLVACGASEPDNTSRPTPKAQTTTTSTSSLSTPALAYFAPYVGKTWRGEMIDAPEPTIDIQKWESVLGGAALRITHSLNDGVYGGETLIYVDKETDTLTYVYVTTAGFRTEGTFTISPTGHWSAEEAVKGHETIATVQSSGYIDASGKLISTSTYINKDGTKTPGHKFIYEASPEAKISWNSAP